MSSWEKFHRFLGGINAAEKIRASPNDPTSSASLVVVPFEGVVFRSVTKKVDLPLQPVTLHAAHPLRAPALSNYDALDWFDSTRNSHAFTRAHILRGYRHVLLITDEEKSLLYDRKA